MRTLTAYIEFDAESNSYVGFVPGLPGAHSVGDTLDELHHNLQEVISLVLEEFDGNLDEIPRFVGIQQIEMPDE